MGIFLVVDGSLISENAYFIRQREAGYEDASIRDIIREIMSVADLCYLSGRKSCSVRGGMIATNRKDLHEAIRPWLPVYEGFYTYGGMSSKEIEAMAVGIREMTELEVAGASADAIKYFVCLLQSKGIPVVTPPGGLACHIDAMRFIDHVPQSEYPAGALGAAVYITSGIRGMERGRSRWIATRTATTFPRIWNCSAWPYRGASTPCRTSNMRPTGCVALRPSQDDRRPGVLRRAARAALLRRQDEAQRRLGRGTRRGFRKALRAGVLKAFDAETRRRGDSQKIFTSFSSASQRQTLIRSRNPRCGPPNRFR